VGATETWEAWGRLRDTVMTGEPGFVLARGMPTYDYLAQNPALGATFDRWMTRQSDQHNAAVVAGYDFSSSRTVADIGGGEGSTLAAILPANTSLRGILLDVPKVVANPTPLKAAAVYDRCRVIGGDMLDRVPGGADAYVLKRVLMIWSDEQATHRSRLPRLVQSRWPETDTGRADGIAQQRPRGGSRVVRTLTGHKASRDSKTETSVSPFLAHRP
jgi:hypothetical protein